MLCWSCVYYIHIYIYTYDRFGSGPRRGEAPEVDQEPLALQLGLLLPVGPRAHRLLRAAHRAHPAASSAGGNTDPKPTSYAHLYLDLCAHVARICVPDVVFQHISPSLSPYTCVYIYIYTHTHIHIRMCVYIYTYIHTHSCFTS